MKRDRSLLWWGLVLAGVGVVFTLAVPWWMDRSAVFGPWFPYPTVVDGAGGMLVACGLLLLLIDGLLRLTARRREQSGRRPPRSLRQVAWIVTGISGGITLVAGTVTWIVERVDYMHPLAQVGWLAFPAGLVASGGLVALLGDALRSATAPSSRSEATGPSRPGAQRRGGVGRSVMVAYAVYLLVSALWLIVFTISLGGWSFLYQGVFLLLCAAVFFRGVWRTAQLPESARQGTHSGEVPESNARGWAELPSLRQWSLASTGGGAGIALTMLLGAVILDHLYNTGVAIGLGIFFLAGLAIAVTGLLLLLVDGIAGRTERRN